MHILRNSSLSVSVNPKGAELCSLLCNDGFEALWQADPAVWNRHAPVLFPIVGKLRDGRYELNGKTYELPQHGFARNMDFTLIAQTEGSLTFQLLPTEETRNSYPFEFDLQISYRLTGSCLSIEYAVRNAGSSVMPFSIGAHPGFTLPGRFDECFLEFEKPETLDTRLVSAQSLISSKTVPVLKNTKLLPLSKTLFDHDALVFMDAKSDKITLGAKNSPRRLSVEFPGFPELGIWAKPGAPFVCIEPWYGYADPEEAYGDIWNKPGILKLSAGETFTCEHRILIEA